MRKTNSLFELFARIRSFKALDKATAKNRYYRTALKEQERAFDVLQSAGLNKEQSIIVDKALSTINVNGAAYGNVAYRLGSRDGIQLMSEVNII